jgi:alpha/beta hydrolase family protein
MRQLKRREFFQVAAAGTALGAGAGLATGADQAKVPADKPIVARTFSSDREDGRFVQTAGFMHAYLRMVEPKLGFREGTSREELPVWREAVRQKLLELMCFPDVPPQPDPKRLWSRPREGYRLERWEAYPEPYIVVPYYVLIPDGASQQSPSPAVVCFPGSTWSKEGLCGEPELGETAVPDDSKWRDNRMAYHYVRRGFVAVAVENPATNELTSPLRGRTRLSLMGIWMGRSYESISVFQKACILRWLVRQPFVDAERVAASGHSLGAKPADILAVLYPDLVRAVVHNDFVCNWLERTVAENLSISGAHQIVPGIFQWFDYTDLEASLAPRPLLFTEGGRANQIAKIRTAYGLLDSSDAVKVYHYEKYADPKSRRFDDAELPVGITEEEYFLYANVDVSRHRFRPNRAVPWLAEVFGI